MWRNICGRALFKREQHEPSRRRTLTRHVSRNEVFLTQLEEILCFHLFPRREVPTFVDFVKVDKVVVGLLHPTAGAW